MKKKSLIILVSAFLLAATILAFGYFRPRDKVADLATFSNQVLGANESDYPSLSLISSAQVEEALLTVFNESLKNKPKSSAPKPVTSSTTTATKPTSDPYKSFSGEDFKNFYDSFTYQKVEAITTKPYIRNDPATDAKIQSLAESRGYKLRYEATCKCLQSEAQSAFNSLKQEMSKAGLNLVLVSGFRSISDQRSIFLGQISGLSNSQIVSGQADQTINSILETRSIPGYSKHHTGYTLDFGCNSSDLIGFKNTQCYKWLSENNYYNAKRFGFIPSYPAGASNQGPNPEEWEYVWVGESNLRK